MIIEASDTYEERSDKLYAALQGIVKEVREIRSYLLREESSRPLGKETCVAESLHLLCVSAYAEGARNRIHDLEIYREEMAHRYARLKDRLTNTEERLRCVAKERNLLQQHNDALQTQLSHIDAQTDRSK